MNAKLIEGNVSTAVRVVASDDMVTSLNEDVLDTLRLYHPPFPADIRPTPPSPNPISSNTNDLLVCNLSS